MSQDGKIELELEFQDQLSTIAQRLDEIGLAQNADLTLIQPIEGAYGRFAVLRVVGADEMSRLQPMRPRSQEPTEDRRRALGARIKLLVQVKYGAQFTRESALSWLRNERKLLPQESIEQLDLLLNRGALMVDPDGFLKFPPETV